MNREQVQYIKQVQNIRKIQFILLAFAALGGLLLFSSQVGARVLDSGNQIPASKIQASPPPPSVPNVVCANGDYTITQPTGATIVAGTTDIGNHGDDVVTNVTLPFTYTLYDQVYSTVNVSSNGNL